MSLALPLLSLSAMTRTDTESRTPHVAARYWLLVQRKTSEFPFAGSSTRSDAEDENAMMLPPAEIAGA
jgi:hypothetical protein